jgi:hypothetical protein
MGALAIGHSQDERHRGFSRRDKQVRRRLRGVEPHRPDQSVRIGQLDRALSFGSGTGCRSPSMANGIDGHGAEVYDRTCVGAGDAYGCRFIGENSGGFEVDDRPTVSGEPTTAGSTSPPDA